MRSRGRRGFESPATHFAERVSVAFADLPIEEGLRRLVVDHHRVFIYRPDAKLDEVRAYRVPPAGLRPVALLPAEPAAPSDRRVSQRWDPMVRPRGVAMPRIPARYSTLDVTAGGSIQDDSLS
jgi:hypothetical protein